MPKKYARIKTRNPIVETWAVRKRSVCCIPLLWKCSVAPKMFAGSMLRGRASAGRSESIPKHTAK